MNKPDQTSSARAVFDNLHSALLVIDQHLCIESMNPSAEMLFHISNNRAHGRSIKQLICNDDEFYQRLQQTVATGHPYTVYEASLMTRAGQGLMVDYMVSPIDYRDTHKSILLEFASIGRHRRIAQEENLLRQHEASNLVLRGLAHEIKNPLGGLRGAAQLLEKELDDSGKEYTRIIIREADRLQNLVDRMLGPRDLPHKTSVNIHKVLEHVFQLAQVDSPDVRFEFDYDPSLPDLHADESMLIQAVLNITLNAVEATGSSGKIIYRTRSMRNYAIGHKNHALVARIDIIDDGPGIPDEIREQIFLPMITGRADGTGMGLSIAQSLITEHGGLIECSSKPGRTKFTLLLPLENNHD